MNARDLAIAKVVPSAPCSLCGAVLPIQPTFEADRGGSLKLEIDCPRCSAYEMVRLSPLEVELAEQIAFCRSS